MGKFDGIIGCETHIPENLPKYLSFLTAIADVCGIFILGEASVKCIDAEKNKGNADLDSGALKKVLENDSKRVWMKPAFNEFCKSYENKTPYYFLICAENTVEKIEELVPRYIFFANIWELMSTKTVKSIFSLSVNTETKKTVVSMSMPRFGGFLNGEKPMYTFADAEQTYVVPDPSCSSDEFVFANEAEYAFYEKIQDVYGNVCKGGKVPFFKACKNFRKDFNEFLKLEMPKSNEDYEAWTKAHCKMGPFSTMGPFTPHCDFSEEQFFFIARVGRTFFVVGVGKGKNVNDIYGSQQ